MSSEQQLDTDAQQDAEPRDAKRIPLMIAGGVGVIVVAVAIFLASGPPGPKARSGPVPEFAAIEDVPTMKATFLEFLAPMIDDRNAWVLEQRSFLRGLRDEIAAGAEPSRSDASRVAELAERYRVSIEDGIDVATLDVLLRHCDVVPTSLALAQAASESGWGRSRFARDGNNYFGEWCFSEGCGIVPGNRGAGQSHEVEAFATVEDAVDSYFQNLNRVDVYAPLRAIRAEARMAGRPITSTSLAGGLERYSERGDVYIEEVRELIRFNKLTRFDGTALAGDPATTPSG